MKIEDAKPMIDALGPPPKQSVGYAGRTARSLFGPGPTGVKDADGNELLLERQPNDQWRLTVRGSWTLDFPEEPRFHANVGSEDEPWRRCSVGSCQRHERCMYMSHPRGCRK